MNLAESRLVLFTSVSVMTTLTRMLGYKLGVGDAEMDSDGVTEMVGVSDVDREMDLDAEYDADTVLE